MTFAIAIGLVFLLGSVWGWGLRAVWWERPRAGRNRHAHH